MDVHMDTHMDTHDVGIHTDVHMDVLYVHLDVHLDVHDGRPWHSCRQRVQPSACPVDSCRRQHLSREGGAGPERIDPWLAPSALAKSQAFTDHGMPRLTEIAYPQVLLHFS